MPRSICLLSGVIAPLIYLALVAGAQLLFPGYDHATQFVSELGGPGAAHPAVFNYGLMLSGALTVVAGGGFFMALRRTGGLIVSGLAGLAVMIFGLSLIIGGIYPLPDERHLAWGLGFAIQPAPLLVLWALWRAPRTSGLKIFLALDAVAVNVLLAVMFGVGDLVGQADVGLWQRAYALAMFPWVAVTALVLLRGGVVAGRSRIAAAAV